jgi:chitodextrinase
MLLLLVLSMLLAGGGSRLARAAQQVLLGDQTIESGNGSDSAGRAQAFRVTATASGKDAQLIVYVSSTSSDAKLVAGLYASSGKHPGALLAQGSLSAPPAGAWDTVTLNSTPSVTAGTTYWIAILSPLGSGTIAFRDVLNNSPAASETSVQTSLTALASTWSTGATHKDGPLSAYGVTGQVGPDTQPPTVPTGLQTSGVTRTSATLSWTAATDNVGVTGYDLYLNGSAQGTTTSTSYGFSGLACGTTYTLGVDAFDAATNKSSQASTPATTSACPDSTPPSDPTGLTVNSAASTSITVSWTASTDNVAVTGYGLYVGGQSVGSATATSTTFTGLSCGGTYQLGVDAYDAAGNHSSAATISASTTPCDTTAPSAPANLRQTDATTTAISVSWDASTDDVGVAGYGLYENGALIGSTPSTSATLSGLSCGTSYVLGLDAYDASGNRSTQTTITASTAVCDTTAPSVQISTPVDGSNVSGTVSVSASASDDVAVAGVQFKLDGNSLGAEITSPPYVVSWDSKLGANGSHTLTALARDSSDNTATASVTVTVSNAVSSVIAVTKVFEGSDTDRQVHFFALAQPVPAGDTVLLAHASTIDATDGTGGIVTPNGVKDPRGNVWAQDAVSHPGTSFTTVEVWSAHVVTPLQAGDLIEVDGYPRGLSDELAIFDVSGLAGPDQRAGSAAYGSTQSTPFVTTTAAHELLVGVHGQSSATAPWWTPEAQSPPWTKYTDRFDGGTISRGIAIVMREVTVAGSYRSRGTVKQAVTANNLIVTYKAVA